MKARKHKHLVLSLATLAIPGIGRFFTGQLFGGILRFMALILLVLVGIEPWYINLIVKISLWAWLVSSELRYLDHVVGNPEALDSSIMGKTE